MATKTAAARAESITKGETTFTDEVKDTLAGTKSNVTAMPGIHLNPKTGATVLEPKTAAAKPAAKVAKVREIVPFADVTALLTELGLTKTQLGQATGKSSSLVSEWVGSGRKTGLNVANWADVQKAARAFAKKGVK